MYYVQGGAVDLHQLKQELQSHLADGLLTVVGSGLSCAEGLPGMGELAKHLCSTVGRHISPSEHAEWDEIATLITIHGLEAALLMRPPTAPLELAISTVTGELIASRERAVMSDVFSRNRKLRLTRLLTHMLKPNTGLPIVTTNYDRLIELAVEDAGLGVDTMFVGHLAGELNPKESTLSFCRNVTVSRNRSAIFSYQSRALVFKPHGSLDWYLRDGRPIRFGGELPGAVRLIITPGQNKFRNGYESPFDIHRERANRAIDQATRYLILGYGFNDNHLETHLLPAIKSGRPTVIMTFQLSDTAETLARNHANVIAMDFAKNGAQEGTRIIHSKLVRFVPGLALWDVEKFVTEILEP